MSDHDAFDPYTGCCYCPSCWAGIQADIAQSNPSADYDVGELRNELDQIQWAVFAVAGRFVVSPHFNSPESVGHLFAAAPELYEAVYIERTAWDEDDALLRRERAEQDAEAALAKARGES